MSVLLVDENGENSDLSCLSNSLRLDWLSVTFQPHDGREMDQILEYVFSVAKFLANETNFTEGAGRRFFAESVACKPAGVLVRWSPFGSKINAGCIAVDLQGDFFELTNSTERKAILLDLADLPGFSKCTRADFQRTIKDPVANSEQIYQMVRERLVWLPGYNEYQPGSRLDSAGDPVDGASTMWGSPQSTVRCTTYNKAAEQKRPDLNVVRHESRTRKEAAHGYWCSLIQGLRKEPKEGPTYAEQLVSRSAIAKHMTYLDTSRFAHMANKKEWPKNWVRDSSPAPFMAQVIDGEVQDLKRAYKGRQDLETRAQYGLKQYGRTFALRLLVAHWRHGQSLDEALHDFFDQLVVRLKDEDIAELKDLLDTVVPADFDNLLAEYRKTAAHNVERHDIPHGL